MGQFMRLTGRDTEAMARPLPSAITQAFKDAPDSFWCARMLVPSMNTMPIRTPRSCAMSSRRPHTPACAQRMKTCAACHQGYNAGGIASHLAPFW